MIFIFAAVLIMSGHTTALCKDIELESLALLYEPENVVTAMRSLEPAIESPAIISVYTKKQIRDLGARTIPELLEFSPGFNPWRSIAGDWWQGPRGLLDSNRNVLVMIDGTSINNQFLGTAYWTYDLLDLSRFNRIEIIRGPGSAMYGPNAILAIINCITEINPPEGGKITTLIGNFDRKGVGVSNVFRSGKTLFDINFSVVNSDGDSKEISKDVFGKSGVTRERFSKKDFMLKISDLRGYTFLFNHVEGAREGYIGYFDNLNNKTFYQRSNDLLSLKHNRDLDNGANLSIELFYNRFNNDEDTEAVSPGATVAGVNYPLGVMENDYSDDAAWGMNVSWKSPKYNHHQFSIRGELSWIELIKSSIKTSYDSPGDPSKLTELTGVAPRSERFNNNSLTIQDDIRLDNKMRVVLDVRYDKHSLFGNNLSSRAALIRRLNNTWTTKFLYGRAYRNPDFHEINNNRNLKKEKIDTYEFQILGELLDGWLTKVNFFINNLSDRIESPKLFLDYRNIAKTTIDGVEFEIKKRFRCGQEVFANLSTFRLRSETIPSAVSPGRPHNKLNLGYTLCTKKFSGTVWGSFSAKTPRNVNDSLPLLPGRKIFNLTLHRNDGFEIADRITLRVRNILNSYLSYTPVTNPIGVLDEYPQPGREISLEMSWDL